MRKVTLNRPQRIVLVVGLGAALTALRGWVIAGDLNNGDWFNYAPNTGAFSSVGGLGWTSTGVFVLTLVLTAVWVGVSAWLLRTPRDAN